MKPRTIPSTLRRCSGHALLRTGIFAVLFVSALIFFIFRLWNQPRKFEDVFYPMGGIPCKVVEYDRTEEMFADDMNVIKSEVFGLEDIFSIYRKESEVSKLNESSDTAWHRISKTLYDGFESALSWYGKSSGAFDISILPLIKLWQSSAEKERVPTEAEIKSVLREVGASKITLSPDMGVKFAEDGMEVDFGGIAKGIILDRMADLVESRGVGKYVISCGGDVVMKGKESFKVGIKDPTGSEGDLMMILTMPPGAVVTSGHYERFSEIDGKRYSHIMDPRTGQPVDNDLVSITIIAKTTTDADALATAVAVLGLEKSLELIEKSIEYKAILLVKNDDGFEIHHSKELSGHIKFLDKWKDVEMVEF